MRWQQFGCLAVVLIQGSEVCPIKTARGNLGQLPIHIGDWSHKRIQVIPCDTSHSLEGQPHLNLCQDLVISSEACLCPRPFQIFYSVTVHWKNWLHQSPPQWVVNYGLHINDNIRNGKVGKKKVFKTQRACAGYKTINKRRKCNLAINCKKKKLVLSK